MNKINVNTLYSKLDSLNIVFKDAQRLIPIIQNLIEFMRDTIPLLENINKSIYESTYKMPRAKNQIDDVTSATEMATTEILDIVDIITSDICSMEISTGQLLADEHKRISILTQIKSLTKENKEIQNLFNEFDQLEVKENSLTELFESSKKIRENVHNITLSLQVQDITTQQLAAVNHLIESVQGKLASIIVEFEGATHQEGSSDFEFPDTDESNFNPDAVYTKSKDNQQLVDDLINQGNKLTSQEEIDKLFLK